MISIKHLPDWLQCFIDRYALRDLSCVHSCVWSLLLRLGLWLRRLRFVNHWRLILVVRYSFDSCAHLLCLRNIDRWSHWCRWFVFSICCTLAARSNCCVDSVNFITRQVCLILSSTIILRVSWDYVVGIALTVHKRSTFHLSAMLSGHIIMVLVDLEHILWFILKLNVLSYFHWVVSNRAIVHIMALLRQVSLELG